MNKLSEKSGANPEAGLLFTTAFRGHTYLAHPLEITARHRALYPNQIALWLENSITRIGLLWSKTMDPRITVLSFQFQVGIWSTI